LPNKINTGLIPAAVYATKTRRALYALLQSLVKKDKEWDKIIKDEIGKLNRALYHLFTVDLKIDKTDVIRLRIEFDVDEEGRRILWKWESLDIEVYKQVPKEEVRKHVEHLITMIPEIVAKPINYVVEKIATTIDGDDVYIVKLDREEVGAALILGVDENTIVLKKAAVLQPNPLIYEKAKISLNGKTVEQALQDELSATTKRGVHAEYSEALKVVNMIREKALLKHIEKPEGVEE